MCLLFRDFNVTIFFSTDDVIFEIEELLDFK